MTETELYLLYRQGFEKVLAILLQKQNKGKYAEREKAILADINKILLEIEVETDNFSKNTIAETYQSSRLTAYNALAITAPKTLAGVDKRTIRELKNLFDSQIYDGLSQVKRNINKVVQKIAIEQKISGGKMREKISDAVDILNKQNIFVFEDRLGRAYNLAGYAEMAIKTVQTSAVNKAVFNAGDRLENDLVKMSSHITSCPLCAMYQGRIYSMSGKDKRYPAMSSINDGAVTQYSTLHPRCRHRFTLYVEDLDDNAEDNRRLSNQPFVDNRTEEQKRKYLVKLQINAYKNRKIKINEKIDIYKYAEKELTAEQKFNMKKLENSRKLINEKLRELTKEIK